MLRSYFWLTFCVSVWGSNFIFGKLLMQYLLPSMVTLLRLLVIVLVLLGLSLFYRMEQKKLLRSDWILIFLLGLIGVFINQWTFFVGLETADPTVAALILATTPILTGFLAAIFLKEKITVRMVIGSLVAIGGILYVVTNGRLVSIQIDKGIIWMIVTMVTFSLMIIMTRYLGDRVDPLTLTLYSSVVGFVISIPFAFLADHPIRISGDLKGWALLIGSAIIVHGIATLVWNNHIRDVEELKASILSNLEPFVYMINVLILLAKPITGIELLGALDRKS